MLIEKKVNLNNFNFRNGKTAITLGIILSLGMTLKCIKFYTLKACQDGHVSVVQALIAAGANLNAQTTTSMTALMWGIKYNLYFFT